MLLLLLSVYKSWKILKIKILKSRQIKVKLVLEWNCSFQPASYKQCHHKLYQSNSISEINRRVCHYYSSHFRLHLMLIRHRKLVQHDVLYCATLSLQHHYDIEKRYHITIPLQFQYIVGQYHDLNPTKYRCPHNIACPLEMTFYSKIWHLTN